MKRHSLKQTIQLSYVFLIFIMIIPTIYSIAVSQIHAHQYDDIISNVNYANEINEIARTNLQKELWDIVCGRKNFQNGNQYKMIENIFLGIQTMQEHTQSKENKAKLEVANRACTTLSNNIRILEKEMQQGSSVTQNEASLDEIRTIIALFSDIMQDFILSEIETVYITNNSIRNSTVALTILQIIIILFSLAVAINGYIFVSRSVSRPLSDMEELSTKIAEGNLSARISVPAIEELVPLAKNLNIMAGQIDLLIKKNIEEQQNFQKAEMKALQAQITPHFLYNTFDTIIWLAEEEKTDDVVKITKAFSDFLRISLSRGHEWITINQELDHIKNYLTIQKIRYADILNYEINVNNDIMNYKIIKLVLQPLVENAIYHGIKNKRGRGHLQVNADYTDSSRKFIRFSVIDDGAGFTAERLEEVLQELNTSTENSEKLTSVYGLYNVNKKLHLYYGSRTDGLSIQSEYNKGCEISFVIPCIVFEDGEDNV